MEKSWYRAGSKCAIRRLRASGRNGSALAIARRMPALAAPSGRRWPARLKPDARSSARRIRTTAASTRARRSSFATMSSNCCRSWSSGSMAMTGRRPRGCQVDTVERGIATCLVTPHPGTDHLLPQSMVVRATRPWRGRNVGHHHHSIARPSPARAKTSMIFSMPQMRTETLGMSSHAARLGVSMA